MDFVVWGRSPWGEPVALHASWRLLWAAGAAALAFMIAHAWHAASHGDPDPTRARAARGRRVLRHPVGARLFHWTMAACVVALGVTAFVPIAGIRFAWVSWHWMAGVGLALAVAYHVVHASVWLDLKSIWPRPADFATGSPPAGAEKYPIGNKLFHLAVVCAGLAAIGSGAFMMFHVRTGYFARNPYLVGDRAWSVIYVAHGFAAMALVAFVMVHVYFAIRPEKRGITWSMLRGWIEE